MSNIRDTDLLIVNRSGFSYQCSKANIGNVRDTDLFIVNRSGFSYQCSKANVATNVRDTDVVIVNRSGFSYQATGADFKALFGSFGPGSPYEGGYYAGQLNDSGIIYNLVVAPKVSGGLEGQVKRQWKNVQEIDDPLFANEVYGRPATEAATSQFPGFWWVKVSPDGPNAGNYDPSNTTGTGIGGFNDWYIPAANEMQIAYFFLKPGTQANDTSKGNIVTSVDPYFPSTKYGPGYPNQTTNPNFQEGGSEAFAVDDWYWSASQYGIGSNQAYIHRYSDGTYQQQAKTTTRYVRAMRRVPATTRDATLHEYREARRAELKKAMELLREETD